MTGQLQVGRWAVQEDQTLEKSLYLSDPQFSSVSNARHLANLLARSEIKLCMVPDGWQVLPG